MDPTIVLYIIDFLLIVTIAINIYVLVSKKYTGVFNQLVESGGLVLFTLSLLVDQFILMCIK